MEALLGGLLGGALPLGPALEWAVAGGDAGPPPGLASERDQIGERSPPGSQTRNGASSRACSAA